MWCEPVWTTLRYGQINLLIAVLVLWDLTRADTRRLAGIGIGIAAGLKLTPALFAVFLALAGLVRAGQLLRSGAAVRAAWNPWLRQAAVATATFLATALLSALALPRDAYRFWTEIVYATDRVGEVEITANQSLRGALARLLHTHDPGAAWLVAAGLTGALGLALAVASLLRGQRAWAAVACAATALLVSPISWSHHWVWCVPMLILAGSEALHRTGTPARRWWLTTGALGLLFCSFALWWVPHRWHHHEELHQNGGQMLLSGSYPLAGLALLALTGARLWRLRGRQDRAAHARPPTSPSAAEPCARTAELRGDPLMSVPTSPPPTAVPSDRKGPKASGTARSCLRRRQGGARPVSGPLGAAARSGRGERVEALQRAVLVQQPPVDRLPVELPVGLDGVAFMTRARAHSSHQYW